MNNVVRVWKDETYRKSIPAEEQEMLPSNPAGEVELTDAQLATVYGLYGDNIYGNSLESSDQDEKANATYNDSDHDSAIKAKIECIAANNVYIEIKPKKHCKHC